jgi:hypothetical protein
MLATLNDPKLSLAELSLSKISYNELYPLEMIFYDSRNRFSWELSLTIISELLLRENLLL